jgi:hypothetical protein
MYMSNSIKVTREWNKIWEKLQGLLGFSGVSSPFLDGPAVIDEPLTIYVETTGNDNNPGTLSAPFKTIRASLEYLTQFIIRAPVTVQVGLGDFDGFTLPPMKIERASKAGEAFVGGSVTVQGTLTTLYAGIATSGSASTLNDTGQNWGVNSLRGKVIQTGTSSSYSVIVSNTATQVISMTSVTGSGAYVIADWGTNIIPNCPTSTAASLNTGVLIDNGSGVEGQTAGSVTLKWLHFNGNLSTTTETHLRSTSPNGASLNILESKFSIPTAKSMTTAVSAGFAAGSLSVTRCFFDLEKPSSVGISVLSGRYRVTSCVMYGSNQTQVGIAYTANASSNATYDSTAANYYENLGTVYNGTGTGIGLLSLSQTMAGTFVNNVNVLTASHGDWMIFDSKINFPSFPVVSTGNTNFIILTKNARAMVHSNIPSGIATNELSVNGVVDTLATMRAASPRIFPTTPNVYGSYVYE